MPYWTSIPTSARLTLHLSKKTEMFISWTINSPVNDDYCWSFLNISPHSTKCQHSELARRIHLRAIFRSIRWMKLLYGARRVYIHSRLDYILMLCHLIPFLVTLFHSIRCWGVEVRSRCAWLVAGGKMTNCSFFSWNEFPFFPLPTQVAYFFSLRQPSCRCSTICICMNRCECKYVASKHDFNFSCFSFFSFSALPKMRSFFFFRTVYIIYERTVHIFT